MLQEHATEAKPRIWNSAAIIAVLFVAGCGAQVTPRAAVKPDTLGRIVWKLKEQEIGSGLEFSLQPGQTVEVSCVLEPPESWRFSTLGTVGFMKGLGCAGINRFGIENESILRRKFSQLLRPSAEGRFAQRNCPKRPCEGKRRPATELRHHPFRVPILS